MVFLEEKSVDAIQAYFWAALTEQGIYGYETAPFKMNQKFINLIGLFQKGFQNSII